MYVIVRSAFGVAAGVFSFFVQKQVGRERRRVLISVFAALVVTTFSYLVPIENAWMVFESPKEVCSYKYGAEPELVIEGNETALFIVNGSTSMAIRTDEGWKIGQETKIRETESLVKSGVAVLIQQYEGCEDGYAVISGFHEESDESLEMYDNRNSEFHIEKDEFSYVCRGYIGPYDGSYSVWVNGVELIIN